MAYRAPNAPRNPSIVVTSIASIALAATSIACSSSVSSKPPSGPLIAAEATWPEDVTREAERADRLCSQRQTALRFGQDQAKQKKDKFKTAMGGITGGVGTVG